MKKNVLMITLLVLSLVMLTACGITHKEISNDGYDPGGPFIDPPAELTYVDANNAVYVTGNRNIKIDQVILGNYKNMARKFDIYKLDGLWTTFIKSFIVVEGDSIELNLNDYAEFDPIDEIKINVRYYNQGLGDGGAYTESCFIITAPSAGQDLIIDTLSIGCSFQYKFSNSQETLYFDMSSLTISKNSTIDWDFKLAADVISGDLTGITFEAAEGAGLYQGSGGPDEAKFATSGVFYGEARTVYKTKEGNYGYFNNYGTSSYRSGWSFYYKFQNRGAYYAYGEKEFYSQLSKAAVYQ